MARLPLTSVVALAVMALAWLVPNHYLPWVAFHSEITAAAGFALLALATLARGPGAVAWPRLALFALALAAVPLAQAASGLILFWGDAWMASLYLLGFALAIVVGHRLARIDDPPALLAAFWLAVLVAALLSVAVQLCQWLWLPLGLLTADLPPGGRPFGNLAQPNHLALLLALGVVAAFALAQARRIGRLGLAVVLLFLLGGIVMAGSRTSWLALGGLALWLLAMRSRARLDAPRGFVIALPALLLAGTLAWPTLDRTLTADGIGSARIAATDSPGTRSIHWISMADAVAREPLAGYGWNQVAVAQARVANDHPGSQEMIEHSHNTVLDLLVWNGVPLGLLIAGVVAGWLVRRTRAARAPDNAFLLAGVGLVLVHAMTEFPLEYAYFLLPLGLMMGLVQGLSPESPAPAVPRTAAFAPALAALGLVAWTAVEYVELEDAARLRRLEAFGIVGVQVPAVAPVLLTQQAAFWAFTSERARPGMTPAQLDAMRRVAERYGYPPVLLRYALAAALNGRPDEARAALMRLCKTHPLKRCQEGEQAWQDATRSQYPQLRAVAFPLAH